MGSPSERNQQAPSGYGLCVPYAEQLEGRAVNGLRDPSR